LGVLIALCGQNVTAPCLSDDMSSSDALLLPSARQILFSTLGAAIGLVGSPDEDFRDTWRSPEDGIALEVGDSEIEVRSFTTRDFSSSLPNKSLDVISPPKGRTKRKSFPRYAWFRGQTVQEILIVRDAIRLVQRRETFEYEYDMGIVFLTERKSISFFLMRENWGGVAMGHEPRTRGDLSIHTQPSTYQTNPWILEADQTRRVLPIRDAWSKK